VSAPPTTLSARHLARLPQLSTPARATSFTAFPVTSITFFCLHLLRLPSCRLSRTRLPHPSAEPSIPASAAAGKKYNPTIKGTTSLPPSHGSDKAAIMSELLKGRLRLPPRSDERWSVVCAVPPRTDASPATFAAYPLCLPFLRARQRERSQS